PTDKSTRSSSLSDLKDSFLDSKSLYPGSALGAFQALYSGSHDPNNHQFGYNSFSGRGAPRCNYHSVASTVVEGGGGCYCRFNSERFDLVRSRQAPDRKGRSSRTFHSTQH